MEGMPSPSTEALQAALATVNDPEIRKPITELGMVEAVDVSEDGHVRVTVLLTVAGCPMKDTITRDTTAALAGVATSSRANGSAYLIIRVSWPRAAS